MEKVFKEFQVGNETMKCYKLKNETERKEGNYNDLCMFLYYENLYEKVEWGSYKNGKRDGFVIIWDKNFGCSKGNCIKEKRTGEWLHIFANDQTEGTNNTHMEKCNYVDGIKQGVSIFFWKDGGTEERYYENGVKVGKAIRNFSNNCKQEVTYINNKEYGESTYYFSDGNYKESEYRDGKIIGDGKLFSKEGKFLKVIEKKEETNSIEKLFEEFRKKQEKELSEIKSTLKLMSEYLVFEKKKIGLSSNTEKRLEGIKEKTGESYEDIINRILDEHGEQAVLESINYLDKYKRKQGKWIEKTQKGKYIGIYENNKKIAEWKEYDHMGKVITIQKYIHGKLYGEEHFDNELYEKYKWEMDEEERKQGEWIFDNTKTGMRTIINYKDGLRHGECLSIYKTGEICEKLYYENGKAQGAYIKYDNFYHRVETQGKYIDGKKEGEWFESDGNRYIYKNGLRIGEYEIKERGVKVIYDYGDDGKVKIEKRYFNISNKIKNLNIYTYKNGKYIQNGWALYSPGGEKYKVKFYEDGKMTSKEDLKESYEDFERAFYILVKYFRENINV